MAALLSSTAVYLDYNAGAPVRPQVIDAVSLAMTEGGNPSSVHGWGRRARSRMEHARALIAQAVGADPRGVVFTSGGTEANALALQGCGRPKILASAIEHPSILNGVESSKLRIVPVGPNGQIDLEALERSLALDSDVLVSVMLANNETGIIQPIRDVVKTAHAHGALVHCDGAQALGRIDLSIKELGVDLLTVSSHKVGGPVGVGALVMANPDFPLHAVMTGGGQERRLRGGTENTPAIVGFGLAVGLAVDELDQVERIALMRDRLESEIVSRVPGAQIIGQDQPRLPNTTCLTVAGMETRTQVMALDLEGVMVGAGAACSSGKMGESAVLKAMGVQDELARSAIRISMGWATTPDHAQRFLDVWTTAVRRKGLEVLDAACAA